MPGGFRRLLQDPPIAPRACPAETAATARLPRLDLPGLPQYLVQRGNNRLPCVLNDGNRARCRQL